MEKRKIRNCYRRRVRSQAEGIEANKLARTEKEMERRKCSNCSSRRVRINTGKMEANTLALIDFAESHNNSQVAKDDRIDFLEAVRKASIVPENGTPPTEKMVEAVFQIMRTGKSLELIMSSYELLNEIEKRFPRVYMSKSSNNGSSEVVIDEAWLPFMVSSDVKLRESTCKSSSGLFDHNGFHELIQCLNEYANRRTSLRVDLKSVGNMLLFQYLVNVLERDFVPHVNVFKESMNWNVLRGCLLNMLLGSRRVNYKVLMRDCLYAVCELCQYHDESKFSETSTGFSYENHDTSLAIASLEVQKSTCMAMQKLLLMIMELDMSKKQADMEGQTTRADGVRTSLTEIILDELTYDRDILSLFLQVFKYPKQKLEIIMQFFLKYTAKPSVCTRRSNDSSDDSSFDGVLKSFSNSSSTRNIIKKMDVEVVQLLLAHAFQAYLSMSSQQLLPGMSYSKEDAVDGSLVDVSKNVIGVFNSLREADENIEISSRGKEALFTAATIISAS